MNNDRAKALKEAKANIEQFAPGKRDYWKNREAGKRGQGDEAAVARQVESEPGGHMVGIGGRMIRANRKRARQRSVDRDYTQPNYEYRTHREVAPFEGHVPNPRKNPRPELPTKPVQYTNYVRHQISKANRAVREKKV